MNKLFTILIIILVLLFAFAGLNIINSRTGSKKCVKNEDCIPFGKAGDSNAGCYNKGHTPWFRSPIFPLGLIMNGSKPKPSSCRCVEGECWVGSRVKVEPKSSEKVTWECGDDVNYKGEDYNTVKIGSQCWLAENLNVGTKVKGETNQTDNGTIEKYCYNDKTLNCETYGGLYQWDEAMQYSQQEGVQGICPDGWHIPADSEWYTLENYLANEACEKNREVLSSNNCKPADVKMAGKSSLWNDHKVTVTSQPQFGKSGLNILPAGGWANYEKHNDMVAYAHDGFYNKGYSTLLWTSDKKKPGEVLLRYLSGKQSGVSRGGADKSYGYSVRCIKN